MPSNVAHYVFGQDVLERLSGDVREEVTASKKEFDIGLQGPDIFFYSITNRRISKYGSERHNQPAEKMFLPMVEKQRSGAALAYIVGLICHYALDRRCHTYVNCSIRNIAAHFEMDSYYDRHIIARRNLISRRHQYIPAAGFDCGAIAELWPHITPEVIRNCVKTQRFVIKFLDRGFPPFLNSFLKNRGEITALSLPDSMSDKQTEHANCLDFLYEMALEECEALIADAVGSMGTEHPVLSGFGMNHKGERPGV